ncbi:MAG: hypothetical protein sL5_05740 [Candidatus Mesenet longicola]|uniref:TrbC/VirB2 family protein n=1 Tax=Candidatus Mesenet longicola TaxID=1892558 RepID=A0A8J3HXX3_9RICK|nr:MAG: hypothetical protein sGL2_06010 [Candidatus Mesenet longicola]GHM59581.1 MAG: hypothetical protein sL5_05740 [Candidatus Mesenet longicola]
MFGFLKCIRIFPVVLVALLALSILPGHATAAPAPGAAGTGAAGTGAAGTGGGGTGGGTGGAANVFENVFCNIYRLAKNIGKPLLLLIVLFIATLAYFGKVQLITIIMIVVGAAIFFGAPTVVNLITGSGAICTSDTVVNITG